MGTAQRGDLLVALKDVLVSWFRKSSGGNSLWLIKARRPVSCTIVEKSNPVPPGVENKNGSVSGRDWGTVYCSLENLEQVVFLQFAYNNLYIGKNTLLEFLPEKRIRFDGKGQFFRLGIIEV
jgi:hypothetical protein